MPSTSVTPLHRGDSAPRPFAGVQPLIVFTGRQIRQLAALAMHDDTEVAVGFARAGGDIQAGLHAWDAASETGSVRLADSDSTCEDRP